ncbi:MAG: hypothetical protein IH840_10235 [Candidatus Heimdallarchaeota archaeon]|nr:hypothetical protein [Candidatus Heimdallarchaeota archaeon]
MLKIFTNTSKYAIKYPDKMNFLELYDDLPLIKDEVNEQIDKIVTPLVELIEMSMQKGEITEIPLMLFFLVTIDVAITLAKKHVQRLITLLDEFMDQTFRLCCKAVKS